VQARVCGEVGLKPLDEFAFHSAAQLLRDSSRRNLYRPSSPISQFSPAPLATSRVKTLAFGFRPHYRYANAALFGQPLQHARGVKGDPPVLVVSRKIGERLLIGDKIAITIVKVAGGAVRLGVEAPAELAVMREELALEIQAAEEAAIEASARSSA
jgi:carbon storage regulator